MRALYWAPRVCQTLFSRSSLRPLHVWLKQRSTVSSSGRWCPSRGRRGAEPLEVTLTVIPPTTGARVRWRTGRSREALRRRCALERPGMRGDLIGIDRMHRLSLSRRMRSAHLPQRTHEHDARRNTQSIGQSCNTVSFRVEGRSNPSFARTSLEQAPMRAASGKRPARRLRSGSP